MIAKICDKKVKKSKGNLQFDTNNNSKDVTNCELAQSDSFGVRLTGEDLREFLRLKQRLQYGVKSKVIHKALKLANKFLDIKEQIKPVCIISKDLFEEVIKK